MSLTFVDHCIERGGAAVPFAAATAPRQTDQHSILSGPSSVRRAGPASMHLLLSCRPPLYLGVGCEQWAKNVLYTSRKAARESISKNKLLEQYTLTVRILNLAKHFAKRKSIMEGPRCLFFHRSLVPWSGGGADAASVRNSVGVVRAPAESIKAVQTMNCLAAPVGGAVAYDDATYIRHGHTVSPSSPHCKAFVGSHRRRGLFLFTELIITP